METVFEQNKITTTTPTGSVVFDIENLRVVHQVGNEPSKTVDLRKEPFSLNDYTKLLTQ
ncbi:hypothetical protein KCV26_11760 [Petrimonas sulfuriphila]|jgi:hypothetical protein|uniref:hypothetical protein n=1 Tax=Petrimonas sulfuriphila TaxID=285070 RepID=UPI0032517D5A